MYVISRIYISYTLRYIVLVDKFHCYLNAPVMSYDVKNIWGLICIKLYLRLSCVVEAVPTVLSNFLCVIIRQSAAVGNIDLKHWCTSLACGPCRTREKRIMRTEGLLLLSTTNICIDIHKLVAVMAL